jgi:hypothetical protein
MRFIKETICLGIVIVACNGCAHTSGDDQGQVAAYMDARADACDANPDARVYRNPYLRSRGISESVCAY